MQYWLRCLKDGEWLSSSVDTDYAFFMFVSAILWLFPTVHFQPRKRLCARLGLAHPTESFQWILKVCRKRKAVAFYCGFWDWLTGNKAPIPRRDFFHVVGKGRTNLEASSHGILQLLRQPTFQVVGKETISYPTMAVQFLWLILRNPSAFPGLIKKTKIPHPSHI